LGIEGNELKVMGNGRNRFLQRAMELKNTAHRYTSS
jgi:hypothetical protein